MRVIVTDGATNKSLAVVRGIADAASFVGVSSSYPISVAGASKHADERYWIREDDPIPYVDRLDEVAREADADQVLPVGGRTFEIVSEHRDRLSVPVSEILPGHESMAVALEKRDTYEFANGLDVPTPDTATVADESELGAVAERIGFPAVLKTGVETEARFVEVVETESELVDAYRTYEADHDSDPLVQEYLPGIGRGYFAMYVDGEPMGGYSHRRIREYPPSGGASACAGSSRDDELAEYANRLLSELDWHGVAMVEFKEDADGEPHLVEINPKFWGSLDLAIESGLNFPRALLEYTEGEESFDFQFTPRCYSWPLSGDLTHAWRRPSSGTEVVEDLLSPHVRTNVRLSDPLPHVVEAGVTLVRQDL